MKLAPGATGVSPRFLALLAEEGLRDKLVLEVGCGWGRLSFLLAPAARRIIGLDRDPDAIREARRRAAASGTPNVEFHEADADSEEYHRFSPDLVAGHLFASDPMIERTGRALRPGGCLALVAFHVDQWRETGKVSRFAYDEPRMEAVLRGAGFDPEVIEVDREERRFASVQEGLAVAVGLQDHWKADRRWHRYLAFLEGGGRTLTRSHLVVKARKR